MNTRSAHIITIAIICGVMAFILLQKHTKERYDPQDMGGRNFWGFGREYGYAQWDNDYFPELCYQVTPHYMCRPGYTRKINPQTNGSECCSNAYNY